MRFVLVHGGLHGAWCWELLIPELERLGHEAVAMDLPGHGERRDEEQGLAAYRGAVTAVMQPGDVLVGHSMGCAVVTLAADARPDVAHVVYLSGCLPVEGIPMGEVAPFDAVGGDAGAADDEGELDRHAIFTEDAFTFDLAGGTAVFYHDCPPELAAWAVERLVPQKLAPILEPISVPTFWEADCPRSYIQNLQDRAWPSRSSRYMAERLGVEALTIDASHSPFLSRPAVLAELLVEAAGTTPVSPMRPGP